MLTYDLSQRGKLPLYSYLYRCIRDDIRSGTLPAESKLPARRSFASHLGVSVNTVERTYDALVADGYVRSQRGSGHFVCEGKAVALDEAQISHADETVVDFKANTSSLNLFPLNVWARLMRKVLSGPDKPLLHTVPFNGLLELRQVIADYLYEFKGVRVSPDRVIVGAGTEFLYGRLLQVLGRQSVIATEDPGYKIFADLSRSFGTLWDYIPLDKDGFQVDILNSSRANVVHVSPSNHFPTGRVMSAERRAQLLEWAYAKPGRYIIEDDYDSELRYSGRALPSLLAHDSQQRVVYMNTFSKTLVPSLRISYMVLPEALMELYRNYLGFYACSVSSFEQLTLAHFISEGHFERHIKKLKTYYRHQRDAYLAAIAASDLGLICQADVGEVGTHFLLEMDTEMQDWEIREAAQKRGGYLVLLSDYCAMPSANASGWIVINFASVEHGNFSKPIQFLEELFARDIERKKKERHQISGLKFSNNK